MSKNYERDLAKVVSMSGEDMTDDQYFMVYDAMRQVFDPMVHMTTEEERERSSEEYHAPQVQPHPDDVWNVRYRQMAKKLWPLFRVRH